MNQLARRQTQEDQQVHMHRQRRQTQEKSTYESTKEASTYASARRQTLEDVKRESSSDRTLI